MENASKALIMAGGVLIGILILSLATYLFVDLGSTSAEIHAKNAEQQITEFNSKFTAYEGYYELDETNGKKNWKITIYDIITLAGYAKENNKYYEDVNDELITVRILKNGSSQNIQENTSSQNEALIKGYINSDGTLMKFECNKIEYNSRGKVKLIVFKEIP